MNVSEPHKDFSKTEKLFKEKKHKNHIKTGLYIREDLHEIIKLHSQATGYSVNQIINKVLENFFEAKK